MPGPRNRRPLTLREIDEDLGRLASELRAGDGRPEGIVRADIDDLLVLRFRRAIDEKIKRIR